MRVKTGTVRRARHNKYKDLAEGFRGRKKSCFSIVKRGVEKSLEYGYIGRKQRKREFRKLWIMRINAGARLNGLTYSTLICGLTKANVQVDRKQLSELAISDPAAFTAFAEQAKAAL